MIASHRAFISESEFTFIVFGRLDRFHLIRVDDGEPADTALVASLVRQGLDYVGIFGLNQRGEAEFRCIPESFEAIYTMAVAGPTFARKAAERQAYGYEEKRQSLAWLERLYDLPDTRGCVDA